MTLFLNIFTSSVFDSICLPANLLVCLPVSLHVGLPQTTCLLVCLSTSLQNCLSSAYLPDFHLSVRLSSVCLVYLVASGDYV